MKKMIFKLAQITDSTFRFFFFLIQIIISGRFKNQIKKEHDGTVAVLANGPSLKIELPRLENAEEFNNVDFIVLNYFALDDVFFRIKPIHYCLADPMFFRDTHRITEVRKLFEILDTKVDWNLNIYIPANSYKQFLFFSKLKNEKLKIVQVNTTLYMGFSKFRNFFYRKGLSCPKIQTVANLAIYIAINRGYKEIRLYGVDHTFFDSLVINEQNQLCNREIHFYSMGESLLKPIININNGRVWRMSEYLEAIMYMFKSHDDLAAYANSIQTNIINCTKNSMIDSYNRG